MTRSELDAAVLRALAAIAPDRDPSVVDRRADVREALDLDSLDVLRFVRALHEALGVDVPERDYPLVCTIEGCVSYLSARLGAP